MTTIGTIASKPARYYPVVLDWEISRNYGDAYWQCTVVVDEILTETLTEYFKDFYIIEFDHQGIEQLIFLGTCPGRDYVYQTAGNQTVVHAFSYDWYLSKQKVQDERLSTVVFDEIEDSYYYKRPDDDFINWLIMGEAGNYQNETGINPRGILQIGEYGDTSTPATAIPERPFIYTKDTWKIAAIKDVEEYLNAVFDVRWQIPDAIEDPVTGKYLIDRNTLVTEPTAFLCGIGNLDYGFNLTADNFITMPDSKILHIDDPTIDKEVKVTDLVDDKVNRVIVWGTMAEFYIAFENLSPQLTNTEISNNDMPFVDEGTFYEGDGVSATVVDCIMDYDPAGPSYKSRTKGTVVVSWDMGNGYEIPGDFKVGQTIVSSGHTATITEFGISDAAVDVHKKVIESPALQGKKQRPVEYFEDLAENGNTRAKVEKRAIELAEFMFYDKKAYTVTTKRRLDLRYLQRVNLFGFDDMLNETWLRIIGIQYKKSENDITVTLNLVEENTFVKRRTLFRQFNNDYQAELERLIEQKMQSMSTSEEVAIIKKITGGNFVVGERLDGTTITKQII